MAANAEEIIALTESICPACLTRIPARRIAEGENVYLDKTCPEHGNFRTIIWRGQPSYSSWSVPKLLSHTTVCATSVDRGCPYDCGLCPDHRQSTCCVLLEVTQRCNLRCPVCFASAGREWGDPDIGTVEGWYRMLMESGGPYNIQLSGGEPTMRDDLPEIISLGRSLGFSFFQLNTNGVRLAEDAAYVRSLKEAGLGCVFLQFDGTSDSIYEKVRGKALLDIKRAAILHCRENQLGVVLVPTLVPGINAGNIGGVIEFAVKMMPTVRGVHFQPMSYFGRYPKAPADSDRITIPEIITEIEIQTGGMIKSADFHPPKAENAYCSFSGSFVLMESGEMKPQRKADAGCCCTPVVTADGARRAQLFVARRWTAGNDGMQTTRGTVNKEASSVMKIDSLDAFLDRVDKYSLCISGMAFQDVWNVDLERLQECFIHVVSPDKRIIPFCAYNLTSSAGRPLYRRACL
ncbi:MAG TPA: radical SAM protein [Dissulfurispiraceae bacterium]|nr:radical SAM protein [Dissulfurispiraceae bacterium]